MLEVHLLTLFPEAVQAYLNASILGRAQRSGLVRVHVLDFRRFATGKHRAVDDRPFGGGPGMVLMCAPIFAAIEWVEKTYGTCRKIMLCPSGQPFVQAHATQLAEESRLLLLCGRYEGFDERIREAFDWSEISIGDFVLAGGELPSLAVIEATARLIPGVLGHEESAVHESFTDPHLLDHPHYTRPEVFEGMATPKVLLSGDHQKVAAWRHEQASKRTRIRRADLLTKGDTPEQKH
jgi:tRNA (guanine37-N1)-methyltransferase